MTDNLIILSRSYPYLSIIDFANYPMFRLELVNTLDVGVKQNIKILPLQSNMAGQHHFYNIEAPEKTNILPRKEKSYSISSQHP